MNQLISPPTPNWHDTDIIACTPNNSIIYGSNLDLVIYKVTEEKENSNDVFIIPRAHNGKISSVNINLNWGMPQRYIVTVGEEKIIKVWDGSSLEKIFDHQRHLEENPNVRVIGAAFSSNDTVISVAENGQIIKWNIKRNQTAMINVIPDLKCTVFSLCPHAYWLLAVGLKNGQLLIVDLRKNGTILHKLRRHDRPVVSLSWCPVPVNVSNLDRTESSDSLTRTQFIKNKRKKKQENSPQPDCVANNKVNSPENSNAELSHSIATTPTTFNYDKPKGLQQSTPEKLESVSNANDSILSSTDLSLLQESLLTPSTSSYSGETSSTGSNNMDLIMDPNLQNNSVTSDSSEASPDNIFDWRTKKQYSVEFLLASSAKESNIYIWRAGTDGGLETFFVTPQLQQKKRGNSNSESSDYSNTDRYLIKVCWISPHVLLSSTNSGHLISYSLPKPRCKTPYHIVNKVDSLIFAIKAAVIYRNIYDPLHPVCTNVWTTGWDKVLLCTDIRFKQVLYKAQTFGSSINTMVVSPFDPNRFVIGTGRGTVHLLNVTKYNKNHLVAPMYFYRKACTMSALAWNPTDERMIAFGTSEGAVGIFVKTERPQPPTILYPYFIANIHKIEWGPLKDNDGLGLYVLCDGKIAIYDTTDALQEPTFLTLPNNLSTYTMSWKPDYEKFLISTKEGGVVMYNRNMELIDINYVPFRLQNIIWHPCATTSNPAESKYCLTFASVVKHYNLVIYDLNKESKHIDEKRVAQYDNGKAIIALSWDHYTGKRLVLMDDRGIAQIYDIEQKKITSTYENPYMDMVLCAQWSPCDDDLIISGTAGGKIIVWKISEHPPKRPEDVNRNRNNKRQLKEVKSIKKLGKTDVIPCSTKKINMPLSRFTLHNGNDVRAYFLYKTGKNTDENLSKNVMDVFGCQSDFITHLNSTISSLKEQEQFRLSDMLSFLKGDFVQTFKQAIEEKRVTPSIIALCPMVSPMLWKQACETYIQQLQDDANGDPLEVVTYLLASHKVPEAIDYLLEQEKFKEAFLLAKARFGDDSELARTVLEKWATRLVLCGNFETATICYLNIGDYKKAAATLFRRSDVKLLELALDIANVCGDEDLIKSVKFRYDAFKADFDAQEGKADVNKANQAQKQEEGNNEQEQDTKEQKKDNEEREEDNDNEREEDGKEGEDDNKEREEDNNEQGKDNKDEGEDDKQRKKGNKDKEEDDEDKKEENPEEEGDKNDEANSELPETKANGVCGDRLEHLTGFGKC